MRNLILVALVSITFLSCKKAIEEIPKPQNENSTIIGHWDNFQQYWLENTETEIHRVETNDKHRHLSLDIREIEEDDKIISIEVREGRNGQSLVEKMKVQKEDLAEIVLEQNSNTLLISGMKHFKNSQPYKFIRTRKFSGWLEYPMHQYKDSVYRKSNLEIHDQGGMAEINIEGVHYTAELTQLLFGHKLPIMKLAIYNMPMDSVEINSRSISYTWLNSDAKRTGINLRKIITGWTFIEPGYINSDNTKFDKEEDD